MVIWKVPFGESNTPRTSPKARLESREQLKVNTMQGPKEFLGRAYEGASIEYKAKKQCQKQRQHKMF